MVKKGKSITDVTLIARGKDSKGAEVVKQYTPTDGYVNVTSLYPTIELATDTEDIIIEAEYNLDLNKASFGDGGSGEDGATFTPSVSSDGVISWTNNKGLSNPAPVNIKGKQGPKGDKGEPDYSIVANALKGTAIGEAVSMKDVSPLEHSIGVKLKSDTITDFSSVTLKKYGKNLLDLTSLIGKSVTANGGTLSCGADGGISGSGTLSGYVGFDAFRLYLPKGKYILSASGTFSNFGCYLTFRDKNNVNLGDGVVNRPDGDFVFDTENYPSYSYVEVTIKRNNNVALSGTAYFQLELGTTATEYEPFKEPIPYKPNADGTVDGVTSLYPTTTLMTDTEGVTITAEYNKDINKLTNMPSDGKEEVLLYTEQTLTDKQKAQARDNIGAAAVGEGGGGTVDISLYDPSQNEVGRYWKLEETTNQVFLYEYPEWESTGKMPISAGRTYIYSGLTTLGYSPLASYFDEDGIPIVGGYFKAQTGENELVDIPSNAKYVSFSLSSNDADTFAFVNIGVNFAEMLGEQLDVVSQKVEELETDVAELNAILNPGEVNLYDKTKNTEDYHWLVQENGRCDLNAYRGWNASQNFPLNSNRKYTYNGLTILGNSPMATYLDVSGIPIVGGYFKAQTGENELVDIPSNAKYVSFSIIDADIDSFVFMESTASLREEVNELKEKVDTAQGGAVYGNLKDLPSASDNRLLIVPSADGGLAYSDTVFWRWAKDNSLALSARAYHTIRVSDGAIINSYNADTVYNVYSVTKLLSSVVACMYITNYDETVSVTASDIGYETATTLVQAGDVVTYEALLNAALIKSDNNAADALRRPVGYLINPNAGSHTDAIKAFYSKMAELAESLGMTNTDCNPNCISAAAGLRSTAADLCKLLVYAFNNSPKVREIWKKLSYTMTVTGSNPRTWTINSTTPESARVLLPEFDGGKTGSSDSMGAYAFCWKDENNTEYATALCEMTLATGDRFQDARHIVDECIGIIG